MSTRKMIHRKKEMGAKGSSGGTSAGESTPPGVCRNMLSNSSSPVVIVMVLTMARPAELNGVR